MNRQSLTSNSPQPPVSQEAVCVKISPFTSWFLDLLRIVAATGVIVAHLGNTRLAPAAGSIQPFGHLMVVCFFVLSGFLIAASVDGRGMSGARYTALRLGRLWSVAIPCLLVTGVLQVVGHLYAPEAFGLFERSYSAVRYSLTALFLNELWFMSSGMPFNLPVWSLAYEAWYYALFGVSLFVVNRRWRIVLLIVLTAIAGPKILLLFPIWLLGVGLWRLFKQTQPSPTFAWGLLSVSVATIGIWIVRHPRWPEPIGHAPWFFSASWASDFIFGLAIAGLIRSVDVLWGARSVAVPVDRVVRALAGVTFTAYLLHYPLMAFARVMVPYDAGNSWQVGGVILALCVIIYAFGSWIEPQRKQWTSTIEGLLGVPRKSHRSLHEIVQSSPVTPA